MTPFFNRAERSALLSACMSALNLALPYSEDEETYLRQVWLETMCWGDPLIVSRLANEIAAQLPTDYVEIDHQSLVELRAREGEMNANLALRSLGFRCRERGHIQTFWTNAPIGSSGQIIKLAN